MYHKKTTRFGFSFNPVMQCGCDPSPIEGPVCAPQRWIPGQSHHRSTPNTLTTEDHT